MTDIDRYVTDDAVQAMHAVSDDGAWHYPAMLRAALPGILAQYKADLLREFPVEIECASCGAVTRERMAD